MVRELVPWSDEEICLLVELKEQKMDSDFISLRLNEINKGVLRTRNSVNQKISDLRRMAKKAGVSVRQFAEEGLPDKKDTRHEGFEESGRSLVYQLRQYDEEHLYDVLKKRSEFMYALMINQAKAINAYDINAQYRDYKWDELLKLDAERKKEVIKLLNQEINLEEAKVSGIGILYAGRDNSFSLVLPIQLSHARNVSRTSLASCLNDAVLGNVKDFLPPEEKANNPQVDRFKDLLRYDFHSRTTLDVEAIEGKLTEFVKEDHPSVGSVYLFGDDLIDFYYNLGGN